MLVPKEICDGLKDLEIIRKSLIEVDYFSCLYERYEVKLLRYVKRLVHVTKEEAEDILQEAFIKIWTNLNAFDQNMKLSSWIYRIVHNQAVSWLRKKKSFGKDQQVQWNDSDFADITDDTPFGDQTELNDSHIFTIEILEQMPLPYKEVLVLKFLENMSYEEISDVLKIPEGTVATRINRAKKSFRKISQQQHLTFDL